MADTYGVKVKLQLTDSKTDLRLQLQTLLNEAVDGNPLQLNKFKVGKGNFREAINQTIKEFNTDGKHNQIQLDNVSFKATSDAIKKLQGELAAKDLELRIGKINADSAVTNLRNQLVKMLSGLQIGGVKEFLSGAEITAPVRDLSNFVADLERLKVMQSDLRSSGKGILGLGTSADIAELRAEYNALTDEITRAIQAGGDWENVDGLQQRVAVLHQNIATQKELNKEMAKAAKEAAQPVQIEMASDRQRLTLMSQINNWLTKNTRATDENQSAMRKLMSELMLGNIAADRLGEISTEVQRIKLETIQAGKAGKTFMHTFVEGLKKFGSWASVTKTLTTTMQTVRRMVDVVISLDSAMTELKRVTDLASSSYDAFQVKAGQTAKRIGATISDTVYATADFARLGFNINEAAELAEAALVYKNIGDGITDISISTESLISTIKAFGYEAADAMYVVDMFNEVGNNFAISSKGIGDALQRSAAALAAGGNTLQESIGLITAANEIIQDPDSVGTAMKTLTMYLRAAKTEAEDAGLSTDGMANSVSELRDEILMLTGDRVDLMQDDNTFKSTFEVMRELAAIWGELTDVSRANILNLIGGKRNANTFSALLNNFNQAIESSATAFDALGSATAENEKYLDSIAGKITQFKAAFEEFSSLVIDSKLVKGVVDLGTALLEVGSAMARVHALLPVITAGFSGFNVLKQLPVAWATGKSMGGMLSKFAVSDPNGVAEIQAFVSATQNYTQAQREMLAHTIKASAEFRALDTAQQAAVLSNMNLSKTAVASAKGLKNLGAMAKTAWSSMSLLSKVSLVISAISTAIAAIGLVIDKFTTSMEEAQEYSDALSTSVQQYQDSTSTYRRNIQTLESLRKKYAELSAGVKENGENASLTDEQYREYLSVVQQIAAISPSVVSNYNSERQAIKLYDDAIQSAIGSQTELIDNQRTILLGNAEQLFKDTAKSYKTYAAELQDQLFNTLINESILQDLGLDLLGVSANEAAKEYTAAFAKALQNIGLPTDLGPNGLFSYDGWSGFLSFNIDNWDISVIRELYDMRRAFVSSLEESGVYTAVQISAIEQELFALGSILAKIDSDVANRVATIWAALEDSGDIAAIKSPEALNAFQNGLVNISDSSADFSEDLANAKKYAEEFINVISKDINGVTLESAFEQNSTAYDNYESYTAVVSAYVDSLVEAQEISKNTAPAVKAYLNSLYQIGDAGQIGADGSNIVTKSILTLSDAMKEIQKNNDVLSKIRSDLIELGHVSEDTIAEMVEQLNDGESILDYLMMENGMLAVNEAAWADRNKNIQVSELSAMVAKKKELEDVLIGAEAVENPLLPDGYEDLDAVSAEIEELTVKIELMQKVIEAMSGDAWQDLDIDFESAQNELDAVIEKASLVKEYLKQLETGKALTQRQIYDMGENIPDGLSDAKSAEEQASILTGAWNDYNEEWASIIEKRSDDMHKQQTALLGDVNQNEDLLYALEDYQTILDEVRTLNIDLGQTMYGNIDTNNRQLLEWTDENLKRFSEAITSWGMTYEDLAGYTSTVLGTSGNYDGIEIAFSPILQTSNGPVLLSAETVDEYIFSLIDQAMSDGEWSAEELFTLDASGLEVSGQHIKGLLAAIGEEAVATSQAMHYVGDMGAIQMALDTISTITGIGKDDGLQSRVDSYLALSDALAILATYSWFDLDGLVSTDDTDGKSAKLYKLADALDAVRNSTELLNSINNENNLSATIDQAEKFITNYNAAKGLTDEQALDWTELIKGFDETTGTVIWDTAKIEQFSEEILDAADGLDELETKFPGITAYLKDTATASEEAAEGVADLGDMLDAIGNATEFRAALADSETDILSMIENAQEMADAYNKIKHPDDAEWDWTKFANNLDTAKSIQDITWSEDALRLYTDAVIDAYAESVNLSDINPELVEQWKNMAYASAKAAEEVNHLSGALDAVNHVQGFLAGLKDKDTTAFDMIEQAQAMADALNELYPGGHGGELYTWENFAKGLDDVKSITDIQWNKDALHAYVNAMVDAYAKDSELSEEAIQNWKDLAFAEAEAALELQNFTDILGSMSSVEDLFKQIKLDMDDDGFITLETLSSLISIVGDKWTSMVAITENGISINSTESIVNHLKSELDALVAAGELKADVAKAIKASFDALLAGGTETVSVYDALASAMDRVSTASSLLSDIQSDEGDTLSMLRQAAKMAEESESSISDFVKVVGDDLVWSEEAITEWAKKSVDALSEYTEITPELREYLIDLAVAEVQAATSAEKMALAYEKANAALAGMPNRGDLVALTYESYNELIKTDKRYATAVEYQNGVLTLNRDIYAGLTENILNETKAQALANMQAILTGDEYTTLIGKLGTLSDKEQQRLTDLNAEIMGYQVLISEIDNANDAYARFLRASTDTQSSRYSILQNALQVVKDTLINSKSDIFGKIGREQYISAVKLLIDPEIEVGTKAFDKARKIIERYVTDDIKGVQNFYDDLVTHGFIDSNRQLSGSAEEMASELGISMNLLRGMIDELNQYQTEENQIKVNFDSDDVEKETKSIEQQVAELHQMITDLNTDLDISHEITLETSAAETAIGRVSSALSDLLSKMAKLNGMKINMYANLIQTVTSVVKNVVTSGLSGISNFLSGLTGKATAGGTRNFSGGRTLVGELGPETVVDPEKGMWYTVGRSGAEFVNLPKGAIVFNAQQTAELFKSGRISDRGQAMALGSGKVTAITADGDVASIKNTVKNITQSAVEGAVEGATKGVETVHNGELTRPGGNGGNKGGSGGKSKDDKIKDLADAYEEANSYLEHLIRHQEHLYEVAENGMDFAGMEASLTEQAKLYRQMMAESKQTVDAMIAAGADDTDEELQKVEETYWAAYSNLYDILQQMNELYVNALQEKIDSIQSSFDSFTSMIDEINKDGTMTVDTFQKLTSQGLQFLNYLELVDGQYVINREALEKLLAAQTEQLAIEQALAYVAQIKQALVDQDAEKIAHLINLTNEIGNSTWDLVYANAALLKTMGLDDDQYAALIHNLDMLRGMSAQVNTGLSSSTGEYDKQGDALDKILEYTKDLIKYETKERIEALEEEIDAYEKLIDQRKEALKLAREEEDYNKSVKDQTKEIAQLQARIAQLSLDDSREARAERAGLEAELAKLQSGLADTQDDHAYEQQTAALDKSAEEYAAKKQQEIKLLEDSISSEEKLYQAALQRISTSWDTLYSDLINWNMAAGNSLNSEIAEAWKVALEAAKEYGTYVDAIVAKTGNPMVTVASPTEEVPKYHSGGVVKANGIQRNEVVAVLEEGEEVLTQSQRTGLYRIVDFAKELSAKLGSAIGTLTLPSLDVNPALAGMGTVGGTLVSNDNAFTFSPVINVQIGSTCDLSPTTARSYGREIGEIAMQEMKEAFTRRGISNIFNNGLKQ